MATDRTLLEGLIDYAGVFPPARHSLEKAVDLYRSAKAGPDGWVLGPFLCLASQLPALGRLVAADETMATGVVLDIPIDQVARSVDQIELKVDSGRFDYGPVSARAPVVYAESREPQSLDFLESIKIARDRGLDVRAKIRTGGESAEAFPDVDTVAAFLIACIADGIPFKATAGLHHPFRHSSGVEGATEFGFVNLLAATRAALVDPSVLVDALTASHAGDFDISTASWMGTGTHIEAGTVRSYLRSFGSCSFDEPAGYLRDLGMLA
ncbi:MAG: hypothetical protein KJN81_10955 [Acidimicrobiia bacterium]|nr:hypothetical protein [Acidimicrobiia bacterium]NNL28935.1 hypothetical protein [Acidimicrobiia bacterium]